MDYRNSFGAALELVQRSAQLIGGFLPELETEEVQHKLEAFRLFAFVDRELRFPTRLSLLSMVCRAQALPPWQRNFALEGVANYFVRSGGGERAYGGMLADPELPETAMVPMHAGMGTALAIGALSSLGENPSSAALRSSLEDFIELCHEQSRQGWHESAMEAMGLAVRTLHPQLLNRVGTEMGEIDENARRLYWHGVGRSLYFVPTNFLTFGGSHERVLQAAVDEAPTIEDRQNTVAGLMWAITLVNIRRPGVLRTLLLGRGNMGMPAAVSNGIVSALMVWKHMAPASKDVLDAYLEPVSPFAPVAELWNELVSAPAARAITEVLPALTRPPLNNPSAPGQPTVASLFQYRDLLARQTEASRV